MPQKTLMTALDDLEAAETTLTELRAKHGTRAEEIVRFFVSKAVREEDFVELEHWQKVLLLLGKSAENQ